MKTILVIAAHPDDEVLGCGGTIARLTSEGNNVFTLILGEGVTSRDRKRDLAKRENEIAELKKQAENANRILGVEKVYTFDFPDNRFDSVPLLDIIKTIEKINEDIKPDMVFTHHFGDLNIDHQITFKAAMTAFRPTKDESVKEIYSFEIPSSTEWNVPSSLAYFMPDYFVNINETLEIKKNALKEYRTELRDFPHPRSLKAVELNAKQWGVRMGFKAAEAFKTIRIRT
jgi:LmbE family N-acetylglucosaminyl deacetylase